MKPIEIIEMTDEEVQNIVDGILESEPDEEIDDTDYIYYAMYKCSLCGEIYTNGAQGRRKPAKEAVYACKYSNDTHDALVPMCEVHRCADNSLGMSQFVGFKRIKKKNETITNGIKNPI